MRILVAALIIPALLTGCFETAPKLPSSEQKVVEKIEYIVKIPPKELLDTPPPPANIDVDTASQSIVAQWILANEDYINKLRNQVRAIAKFLKDEQDKADDAAKKKNDAAVLKPLEPLKPLKPLDPFISNK